MKRRASESKYRRFTYKKTFSKPLLSSTGVFPCHSSCSTHEPRNIRVHSRERKVPVPLRLYLFSTVLLEKTLTVFDDLVLRKTYFSVKKTWIKNKGKNLSPFPVTEGESIRQSKGRDESRVDGLWWLTRKRLTSRGTPGKGWCHQQTRGGG